jgi:hypothetical protein
MRIRKLIGATNMSNTSEENSFVTKVVEEKKLPPIFSYKRKETGVFSAITLSLILAACGGGGGGGGGAVSTTPTDGGSTDGGSTDGGSTDGGSTDSSIQLDGGAYSATSAADVFTFDVSFDGTSIVGLDNNVSITGFDPENDSIVLRGEGGSSTLDASTLLSSSGVDVSPSTINNNTVIYFSPNSSGASSSITLEGIVDGDLSSISISAADGSANDTSTSPVTGEEDLSEGTVTATSAAEAFVYEIKFVDGVPVAIDGDVTIKDFDAASDTITLQAASVPSGFGKSSLLSLASSGVEIVTSTIDNKTTIYFAPDSSGTSGSITFDGIVDADLSSITLNILSGSVDSSGSDLSSGSNIELGTDDLTAQSSAENFVFDASYASSTLSGSDGPLTITGFDQANDKLVILASDMPVGYDLNDFKIATGIDIVASTIDNNTTIYFAPDADGNSTSITLAGIVDGDLASTSIEFTSSLTGGTSSGTVTSTDTSASADATSDATDTSTADSTDTTTDDSSDAATDDTADTTADDTADTTTDDSTSTDEPTASQSYTVVDIATATEDTTITATDAAEEFRYEFSGSTSSEGNFIITIDNFDSANDKIVLVNVGGNDLTTSEFTELSGVEISGNSFDNQTRILFDKDSSGGSGELAVNGVYDSDLSVIAIEILSDTNIT